MKQIRTDVNKMGGDTAGHNQSRREEITNEMNGVLVKGGWKKDFVEKGTPKMPVSGWMGDDLLKKSGPMGWWNG